MSIRPIEFLEQAQKLLSDGEADNRTACSRAYYAAYHASQQHYHTLHDEEATGGMHKRFIHGLIQSPNLKDKGIGYKLQKVYRMRLVADYKLERDLPKDDAQSAIKLAEEVLERLTA